MPVPIVRAAWRYLMDSGALTDLVGPTIGTDATWPAGWVFAGDRDGNPFRAAEGTGKVSVVLFSNDHWSAPGHNHTAQFPLLRVNIFADPDRDAGGQPTKHNAEDKAQAVYDRIRPLFHDAANRVSRFDDLPIISTVEGSSLGLFGVPEGDGTVMGVATYEIALH